MGRNDKSTDRLATPRGESKDNSHATTIHGCSLWKGIDEKTEKSDT